MTEAEWRTGTDPAPMLAAMTGAIGRWPTDRKTRLFACDCCRRLAHLMTDLDRAVLDAVERCAEGLLSPKNIVASLGITDRNSPYTFGCTNNVQRAIREAMMSGAWEGARRARAHTVDAVRKEEGAAGRVAEWKRQSDVLRCIFGNPFRRVRFSADWRTDTALTLARQMYEAREFSALPILADALQDAGCDNDELLAHARAEAPHARGCWVVDLVLGKE